MVHLSNVRFPPNSREYGLYVTLTPLCYLTLTILMSQQISIVHILNKPFGLFKTRAHSALHAIVKINNERKRLPTSKFQNA